MTRRLVGLFDPRARADRSRLRRALAPDPSTVLDLGALQLAFTGPPAGATDPLCLLDGHLDVTQRLAGALSLTPDTHAEYVLGAGWRRWGDSLLARLRGDFAVLLWDQQRGEGLLARDQLGVRSLFVCESDGVLRFAGELRDLLALLARRPAPDALGVAHWVAGHGRGGSGTLYEGVRRLGPGALLRLRAGETRERRYWTPRFHQPADISDAQVEGQVRDAMTIAVKRRLSADGTTGVLMSGGLDSAAVAAIAASQAPGGVAAYSGVFPEHRAVDESELIEQLRMQLSLHGATAEVRAGGLLASALESQHSWQVPLVGWGEFWTVPLLRHAAACGSEMVLGGDGGDELFATRGYLIADRLRAASPRQALRLVRSLPGAGEAPPLGAVLRQAARVGLAGALSPALHSCLRRPFAPRDLPGWLRPQVARGLAAADDPLAWKRLDGPRWWSYPAHLLTRGVEELGVFETLRRTAALAGVEVRHPLFDLDLVELVLGQPPLSSFDPHLDRPALRASMKGLLPDVVRLRRAKALFDSLIIDSLLGSDGGVVRALLSDPRAELGAFVDLRAASAALLADGQQQPFIATQHLWRLVTAECWLRAQADPHAPLLPAGMSASAARVAVRSV